MKVLVLANFGMGLYNFRKELLQELIDRGYEVYISISNDEYVPKLVKLGCKFIDTPVSRRGTNPITDFKLFRKYRKIIKKINPDVVLTYTIKPNIYGGLASKLLKTPYIANITGLGTAVENGGLLQKTTLFLYKAALKRAKCVLFQNKENKDFLVNKKVVKGNNRVLPGSGVNLKKYTLMNYPDDDIIKFLFIFRVMKRKGIDKYLEEGNKIKKIHPNTEFHVVGFCEEAYEDKLEDLDDRGIIKYHGQQTNVRSYYQITHCTIHPTYYLEGMSNVLLESAASGRPIITTDKAGCKEIVIDGVSGYLIKQQSSEDLISKIRLFLALTHKEKEQMGYSGRVKVQKEFNRKIIIDNYLTEIEQTSVVNKYGL